MKFLNLGCGSHYSNNEEWTNIDFASAKTNVIGHNLLNKLPFLDNSFDLVYHSHVLEHFSKEDGAKFVAECMRVLKPGGTLRIAIPDLERMVKKYLSFIEKGLQNPDDELNRVNYEWILIEMYDQTVRNYSGGRMAEYLGTENILNENFVYERIGLEGKNLREKLLKSQKKSIFNPSGISNNKETGIKSLLKNYLIKRWGIDMKAQEIGKFRLGGEVHQWMYDRYSLFHLLQLKGGNNIQIKTAFTSNINNWADYELDGKAPIARKPDSLFIEAIK